ncbi:MAG: hypothetical protein LBB24_02530 [Rickettsiales bacterium]|jgi:hypothetical protein|nr:hypothetical protein [Rickettsiales bacterium]
MSKHPVTKWLPINLIILSLGVAAGPNLASASPREESGIPDNTVSGADADASESNDYASEDSTPDTATNRQTRGDNEIADGDENINYEDENKQPTRPEVEEESAAAAPAGGIMTVTSVSEVPLASETSTGFPIQNDMEGEPMVGGGAVVTEIFLGIGGCKSENTLLPYEEIDTNPAFLPIRKRKEIERRDIERRKKEAKMREIEETEREMMKKEDGLFESSNSIITCADYNVFSEDYRSLTSQIGREFEGRLYIPTLETMDHNHLVRSPSPSPTFLDGEEDTDSYQKSDESNNTWDDGPDRGENIASTESDSPTSSSDGAKYKTARSGIKPAKARHRCDNLLENAAYFVACSVITSAIGINIVYNPDWYPNWLKQIWSRRGKSGDRSNSAAKEDIGAEL